jgi:hypothetical protein
MVAQERVLTSNWAASVKVVSVLASITWTISDGTQILHESQNFPCVAYPAPSGGGEGKRNIFICNVEEPKLVSTKGEISRLYAALMPADSRKGNMR